MTKNTSNALRQQCPICGTTQPIAARHCTTCGAALSGTPAAIPVQARSRAADRRSPTAITTASLPTRSNWAHDESDLYEGALPAMPRSGLLALIVALALIIGAGILIARSITQQRQDAIAALPTRTATEGAYPTNTPHPTLTLLVIPSTLDLPTITPTIVPPTITATRGPCTQKAQAGDTLSGLAARCGQYSMAVIPTILFDNQMSDPAQLRAGQIVQIPWPTSTGQVVIAANAAASPTPSSNEATLPPGVTWYTVKDKDDAISVAFRFHTTIQFIHDLNPEIADSFSQCDYGQPAGGATCTVQLSIGQRLRVPAPTPTPTRSPIPNGRETAAPSLSPTLNLPYLDKPGDNMLYVLSEQPTLRWGGTGTLGAGQAYLLAVTDVTMGKRYAVVTSGISFQVPIAWQPNDGSRHVYQWSVSIVNSVQQSVMTPITVTPSGSATSSPYSTGVRTFTWQGP